MSSADFPCSWSSPIIRSWRRHQDRVFGSTASPEETSFFNVPRVYQLRTYIHTYHERGPAHGGTQAVEGVGGAELGDDPVVAVPLDDGLVEVEHHHQGGGHLKVGGCLRKKRGTVVPFSEVCNLLRRVSGLRRMYMAAALFLSGGVSVSGFYSQPEQSSPVACWLVTCEGSTPPFLLSFMFLFRLPFACRSITAVRSQLALPFHVALCHDKGQGIIFQYHFLLAISRVDG